MNIVTPVQQRSFNKKPIVVSVILIIILMILAGASYYYIKIYRNREIFPKVNPQIDDSNLESLGFQKISSEDRKYSYYIPNYWTKIDQNAATYGDILNGSNSMMASYPNSIGVLNKEVCDNFGDEAYSKLKDNILYSTSTLIDKKITSTKNYSGCFMELEANIGGKDFKLRQFFIFQKNRIYQIFIQTRKDLESENEITKTILDSIYIDD